MISDGYAQWYADHLWSLIPAIYRSLDAGPTPNANGPLRELINRIGAQAAVVRRSIDRLGENQSIELCDDWVIPYIGDLVATRLVSCLDADAQRIDVAKTIYYRRRAGTLGILEQLAADIATIDARCVEFFRRLGRTRHQFDPPLSYQIENPVSGPIGFTSGALEIAEGLVGPYSGTPAGGFADLRNRYAASNTGNAFDEFSYTADLRAPLESLGWYNIRNLGVFLWWLQAFPIAAATPVSGGGNPATGVTPCFTFDPSGRDMPLFAPSLRAATSQTAEEFWGENWASPDEWVLPVAIRQSLWNQLLLSGTPDLLYGNAFWVGLMAGGVSAPVPVSTVTIHPERGRFSFPAGAPVGTITVNYSLGLLLAIGAGGYNDDILTDLTLPGVTATVAGGAGGPGLDPPLAAISTGSTDATLVIDDSLTYTGPTQTLTVPAGCTVAVKAQSGQRPVLRWTTGIAAIPATWTITGDGSAATGTPTILILEGLWLVGADIILTGTFDAVYLRMVTIDPGTASPPGTAASFFQTAIDDQPLGPGTLWIEGSVTNLTLERSITGPIRTRNGGVVITMNASDSVIQSIPTHAVTAATPMAAAPTPFDAASLAASLKFSTNSLAATALAGDAALSTALDAYAVNTTPDATLITLMTTAIQQFSRVQAEAAWPLALADLALGFQEGAVSLSRCTVLGPTYTHQLSASESILDDLATVEDAQAGCVRFSAYASGSTLHQPFRSVQIAPGSPLFRTRDFNQPEYVRLRDDTDTFILAAGTGINCCTNESVAETILEGAQNGSEMGVYCLARVPLKRRGLVLKFEEYAPIGQLPVWIDAD
jgi:hypothetical protein